MTDLGVAAAPVRIAARGPIKRAATATLPRVRLPTGTIVFIGASGGGPEATRRV